LYVSLLYLTYRERHKLPLTRAAFYRQVYDALYSEHDLTKEDGFKGQKISGLSRDELDSFLQRFAFQCMKEGINDFEIDGLLGLIAELLKDSTFNGKTEPSVVFSDLVQNVPLLIKEGSSYKWIHKSFMEYFAAKYIFLDVNKIEFLTYLWENQLSYLDDFSNLLTLYVDIDRNTFNDIFVRKLLEDFVSYVEQEGNNDNIRRLRQIAFHREFLLLISGEDLPYGVPEVMDIENLLEKHNKRRRKDNKQSLMIDAIIYEGSNRRTPSMTICNETASFYNLQTLLRILYAKGYPFIEEMIHYTNKIRGSVDGQIRIPRLADESGILCYLHHGMCFEGTKEEQYAKEVLVFMTVPVLIISYDKAKEYLEELDKQKKHDILRFMRK